MRRLGLAAFLILAFALPASPASAVSRATSQFVASFEGYLSRPYNDPVGYATVGYGHLIAYRSVTAADRRGIWVKGQKKPGYLSKSEALRLLRTDLAVFESELFRRIGGAKVTEPMITALTSFAYNLGPGYLDPKKSKWTGRTAIAANVKKGNYVKAARQMRVYDGVVTGGRRYELPGLTRRRNEEFKLMIKGIKLLGKCGDGCQIDGNSGGLPVRSGR